MEEPSRIAELLRKFEEAVRHRTKSRRIDTLATRLNSVIFFGFDQVFWSRVFRSRRGPISIELPLRLLRRKGIEVEAPVLHVSGLHREVAHWDEGFAGAYAVLFENLQQPNVLSPLRYVHPGPAFRGVYLWDSAFIAQIWKHWDRETAHEVLLAVIHLRDGDRLQHVVSDFVESAFTQPPLIAWSLGRVWEGYPEEEIRQALKPVFPILARYHAWLYEKRRLDNGLFFWEHPYESGMENAPRFSSRDESELHDTRPLAAPDLSSYVVLQNDALARMADWLGEDPAPYRERAEQLREKIRSELWHEEDGYFYDRNIRTGEFVRSRTIASLMPLWAGAASPSQAERLVAHVLDPKQFNSLIPLPSVAVNDKNFSPDMWRGPVWVNTAFGILQGLKRYGYEEAASDLSFRLCDGVYRIFREDRYFYEFYDPERLGIDELHRKKGNRWKAFTLGTKPQSGFVGWTGLVNTLVIDQFFGFHRRDGLRHLCPRFPTAAAGNSYALRLPTERLAVEVTVFADHTMRVSVRKANSDLVETHCRFGEVVPIDQTVSPTPHTVQHATL